MRKVAWRRFGAGSAALGLALLTTAAQAGGFAVREQSAEYQGMSFAGAAAGGGGLSGMFWNPAVAAQFDGIWSNSNYSLIIPDSEIHALPGSTLLGFGDSGDIGNLAIVPASYFSYQVSPNLVLALGINAPFGLTTEPSNRNWAGMTHARTSDLKTYNFTPTLAYRVSPTFAVGVGLQIEYIKTRLKNAFPLSVNNNAVVEGDDITVGFTAGALWNPQPGTSVGIGFRSALDHSIEGSAFVAGLPGVGKPGMEADVTLPETVTLSLRQALTPQLTALATAEWTNWSRLDQIDVVCTNNPGVLCPVVGNPITSLQLNWHDGWFISGGLEYLWNPQLTLRGGVGWERSPIQNASERSARVPDADRLWTSIGASYKWSPTTTLDFAYTHIFVDDAQIDRTETGGIRLVADVDSSVDIVSFAVRMKLGVDRAPMEPLK